MFMNIYESKVLNNLYSNGFKNQRDIANQTGLSLGLVNKAIQSLKENSLITEDNKLSEKAQNLIKNSHPKNAVILAAGYGLRMVPINMECPKGLITVGGEPLVERVIKQLHEVGVTDITIVVGFMKEKYDYLIDSYDVKLVYNKNYSTKNNLHSLNCVQKKIENTYIVPCDIWCKNNPFNTAEFHSWYLVTDAEDENSTVRISRMLNLETTKKNQSGNKMIGISYINKNDSVILKNNMNELCSNPLYDSQFWEAALFEKNNITVCANEWKNEDAVEINSCEQLRELDSNSKALETEAFDIICKTFNCTASEITNIQTLKKGMTNRSFIFSVNQKKYIMRIPGEGTDKLINRRQEADVYNTIKGKGICDELYYINPENGYKITAFIENARNCDAYNFDDVSKCLNKLRDFHNQKLKVKHGFDIFGQMDFYESLWKTPDSVYSDYKKTKANVLSLIPFIEKHKSEECLTHIDAICDNFLFSDVDGKETVQLIDWEYAGMQDPHVDIAMFCIYAMYDSKEDVDHVIDLYFENKCTLENRIKIYCYISACGLLWSNWCEFKSSQFGIEFGEYNLKQYRFAKEYYRYAAAEIKKLGE